MRYHVFFEGRVQGVGFRWTAERIARQFDVTGFVKNLPDGRVEIVAESASQEELNEFLQAISEKMAGNIGNISKVSESPTGEFHQFRIDH